MLFKQFGIKIEYISANNDEFLWLIQELRKYKIDTVLDVGANSGQYGVKLRQYGFDKSIISFEPLQDAFNQLQYRAGKEKNWICNNFALGDKDERTRIEVAGNSYSSSLLPMLQSHIDSAPDSKPVGYQDIVVKRLDSVFTQEFFSLKNIFLKIDTQGYEMNVLKGAHDLLKYVKGVQVEMSFVQLYEKQALFPDVYEFLIQRGMKMVRLENEFSNPQTGELLQVNGTFFKI